ncbi:hypothetical protein EDB85DRAFT_1453615 [Lactarius pseudohatsudake]|nr:hypothetical protein EDB85DRAFT_1453615 [Lactarius pseudohatsudake]
MALPRLDLDIEAQTNSVTETQSAIISPSTPNAASPQLPISADLQPQATDTNQYHNGNASAAQTADNSQRDENQGDSSDGLWSIYLTESEKQDAEVLESWKGDTNGILVFTGLFSATVAAFIIESYKKLSPDSGDMTNALLIQISQQFVDFSHGKPLANVAVQSGQPFKPRASAVRVNVFWFLSLILSLSCALSATLMQQWARRYQELAQRHGAFHRRGRMRAYIFDGIHRFGMARAVATMPTLLHISVFLFFAGLVEFLFPIYTTVAYATLGCIMVFALAYAILTVLPTIRLNCPYGTPLSGFTWLISQLSMIGFYWAILNLEGLFRISLSKLWCLDSQHAPETHGLKRRRETLEQQVKIRRQWFSQGLRKTVELGAYRAESRVVTNALVWTLAALDEDKEIEDFAARVPGFFDSRVVPDAKLAILPLMSHQPNTDPILGSRLYDLLKTCIPETSILDEKTRQNRLRVCMKCLWSFAKACNQLGPQVLPSYFQNALASPEITRVRAEKDTGVRVIGRCFAALIANKLATDLESRTSPISRGKLASLSAILGTKSSDVELLLIQPGAVALVNMTSLMFDDADGLVTRITPSGVLDVVQQTLDVLSQALSSQQNAEAQLDQPIAMINGSDGVFECTLKSHLLHLLNTCMVTSPLTERVRTRCLRVCLKGLWYFGRTFNQPGNSVPFSSHGCVAFTNPEMIRRVREQHDLAVRVIGRCVEALVVNKLAADIKSRNVPVSDDELACLSAILGTKSLDVMILLNHPGAIEFTNMIFLALDDLYSSASASARVSSDIPDVVKQTFGVLSRALPNKLDTVMPLYQTGPLVDVSNGTSPPTAAMYRRVLRAWMMNLWHFTRELNEPQGPNSVPLPSYVRAAFTNQEMTRRIREERDLAVRVIGRCVGALVVNKLAADINSRNVPVTTDELACLSAILGTKSHDDVKLLLSHQGAIEFTNMVFLTLDDFYSFTHEKLPSCVLDVVQKTSIALSQGLPLELIDRMRINQTDYLVNISDVTPPLTAEIYRSVLRGWMMNLWHFTGVFNGHENSVPLPSYLPSYVCAAFANPEMSRRIREERDLAARVIGRCAEVLVVNKLAADIKSRVPAQVTNNELACLSATLGTKSCDTSHLLNHIGAIEFTNMVFFILDDFYSFTHETVPSDVLKVVRQTSGALSRVGALPPEFELNTRMQLNLTDTLMSDSDGTSPLTADMYRSVLRMWMENLWHCIRWYYEPGDSVPLSSPLWIAFASPEMTRRIHEGRDLTIRVIGRCIEALVISKLAADINSRNDIPVCDDDQELVCLATILGAKNRDVMILLSHPGAIEFTMMVFLALDNLYPFTPETVPLYVLDVVRQTFGVLSQALPAELNAKMPLGQTDTLIRVPNGAFFVRG